MHLPEPKSKWAHLEDLENLCYYDKMVIDRARHEPRHPLHFTKS